MNLTDYVGSKVIGLPGDRIFVIGGSRDSSGRDAVKGCTEIVNGLKHAKTAMFLGRTNFGCAVYPNFTQIFITGG